MAFSILPIDYDYEWIAEQANTIIMGVATNEENQTQKVEYEDINFVEFDAFTAVVEDYGTLYLEVAKPKKILDIVALRKEKTTIFSFAGYPLTMDYVTEARITSAVVYLQRNPEIQTIQWDLDKGNFVTMDREDIFAFADAAGDFVQGCFAHSKALTDLVNAATNLDELNEIDITAGWPES